MNSAVIFLKTGSIVPDRVLSRFKNILLLLFIECDSLIHNKTEICTDRCKNTLVGLTSTPEGQKLMNCDCDGDLECEVAKVNIEACRDSGPNHLLL